MIAKCIPKYEIIHTNLFMTNQISKGRGLAQLLLFGARHGNMLPQSETKNRVDHGPIRLILCRVHYISCLLSFLVKATKVSCHVWGPILPPLPPLRGHSWTFYIITTLCPSVNFLLTTSPSSCPHRQLLNDPFVYFYERSRILPDQVKLKKN